MAGATSDATAAAAVAAPHHRHKKRPRRPPPRLRGRNAARLLGPGQLTAAALLVVAATCRHRHHHSYCGPPHAEAFRPPAGRAASFGCCRRRGHPLLIPAETGFAPPLPLRYKSLLDDEGVELEEPPPPPPAAAPTSVPRRGRWRRAKREGAAAAAGVEDEEGREEDGAEAEVEATGDAPGHRAEGVEVEEAADLPVAATNETTTTTSHADADAASASASPGRLRGAVMRGMGRLPRLRLSLSRLVFAKSANATTTADAADAAEGAWGVWRKKEKQEKGEKEPAVIVRDVHELRRAVLVRGIPLKDLDVRPYGDDDDAGEDEGGEGIDDVREIVDGEGGDAGEDGGEVAGGSVDGAAAPTTSSLAERTHPEGAEAPLVLDHEVLRLIAHRVATKSTPGNRHKKDGAHLALAIEGGGMRGAVSAGMAAAVASLGLSDAFDSIYGSSAGSVVGAYMVSRQMCVDVYTEVLPAAKKAFVCKNRILGGLVLTLLQEVAGKVPLREGSAAVMDKLTSVLSRDGSGDANATATAATDARSRLLSSITSRMPSMSYWSSSSSQQPSNGTDSASAAADSNITSGGEEEDPETSTRRRLLPLLMSRLPSSLSNYLTNPLEIGPGMNISFVLDGILSSETGLRPFDFDSFRRNDLRQPLKVVASSVRGDKLETVAFGSREGDFFPPSFYDGLDLDDLRKGPGAGGSEEGGELRGYRFTRVGKRMLTKAARKSSVVLRGAAQKSAAVVRGVARRTPRPKLKRRRLMDTFGRMNPYMNSTSAAATIVGGGEDRHGKWEKGADVTNTTTTLPSGAERRHHEWRVTSCPDDPKKVGFFGCLECSMLVPGAAGPPVPLLRSKYQDPVNQSPLENEGGEIDDGNVTNAAAVEEEEDNVNVCFDAFSFEAIPYRSAVYGGNATHVLCLRSRPDGAEMETKPGVYERVVAPLYFRSNNLPSVAEYFANGGQQYRYLEDIMTLDEGLEAGCGRRSGGVGGGATEDGGDGVVDLPEEAEEAQSELRRDGVKVPPTDVLYGLESLRPTTASDDADDTTDITESWKRAHLLPLVVPRGTPELPSLAQDREEVVRAVRNGYAAAFEALAPVAGLDVGDGRRIDGHRVAELMFPIRGEGGGGTAGDEDYDVDAAILGTPVEVKGDAITEHEREKKRARVRSWVAAKKRELLEKRTLPWRSRSSPTSASSVPSSSSLSTASPVPLSTDAAQGAGDSAGSSAAAPLTPPVTRKKKRSWASLLSKRLFGIVPVTDGGDKEESDALSQEIERISAMAAAEASLLEEESDELLEAQTLLASLPGFRSGKLTHLAGRLRSNETMYNV